MKKPAITDALRKAIGVHEQYVPRKRKKGEALPQAQDLFDRDTYRYGDGDPQAHAMQRPGSCHKHIKSWGF